MPPLLCRSHNQRHVDCAPLHHQQPTRLHRFYVKNLATALHHHELRTTWRWAYDLFYSVQRHGIRLAKFIRRKPSTPDRDLQQINVITNFPNHHGDKRRQCPLRLDQ
ncbi:hypothetical protein GOP47_0015895 [Adiantum capillus-veneris]|uniref:Uncharacterized protein n=1 Tax=Adiantum capillus-veneris TaxID=13818 RepID=A0A9D4ZC19_ADICA|nr:hypothetical protein GOP47_0015895 [Adiantum capillus-veneris]